VVFFAAGFLIFGPRVPREVHLRFDLPPTIRGGGVAFPRERASELLATITATDGDHVATISLQFRNGLSSPRTGPAVINVRSGRYVVRVRVRSFEREEAMLDGFFEAETGEVLVELK
jgi:hypothetical protein